jgi:hypothetical protein
LPSVTLAVVSGLLERLIQLEVAYLPDDWCCCHPRYLCGLPPTLVGEEVPGVNLWLRLQLGVIDSGSGCCRPLDSFVGVVCVFPLLSSLVTEFLSEWRCSNFGLAVSTLVVLSLRTAVKSCCTSLYTPHRALYSYFPSRSWWRFLPVPAMFWTITVHFKLSLTHVGVHSARTASPSGFCCMVFSYSNLRNSIRFHQIWISGVDTLAIIWLTTYIIITVYYIQEPQSSWSVQAHCQATDFTHFGCTKQEEAVNSLHIAYCGNFVQKLSAVCFSH